MPRIIRKLYVVIIAHDNGKTFTYFVRAEDTKTAIYRALAHDDRQHLSFEAKENRAVEAKQLNGHYLLS